MLLYGNLTNSHEISILSCIMHLQPIAFAPCDNLPNSHIPFFMKAFISSSIAFSTRWSITSFKYWSMRWGAGPLLSATMIEDVSSKKRFYLTSTSFCGVSDWITKKTLPLSGCCRLVDVARECFQRSYLRATCNGYLPANATLQIQLEFICDPIAPSLPVYQFFFILRILCESISHPLLNTFLCSHRSIPYLPQLCSSS